MLTDQTMAASRRMLSSLMQGIATKGQKHIAEEIGVSEATVSRFVSTDLERACEVISLLGFQLATRDAVVVSQEDMQAIESLAFKYLQARQESWKRKS